MNNEPAKNVGLFVTCLVDLMRPTVGFAAVRLLEKNGCTVRVPDTQTCCGQPAYNAGAEADARVYLGLARKELSRLASIYTEREDREVLARRVEKILTCLPLIYLFRAQDVVSGWTEMPAGSGKDVVRWIERARMLLESTPLGDEQRRELKSQTDRLLEKVNAMVRAGSSDETGSD